MYNYQQYQGFAQAYTPQLAGRAVQDVSQVGVGEVPTDGSTGWFPALDGSCVWARRWNGNGTIETVRYVPEPSPEPVDELAALRQRLEAVEAALAKKSKRKESAFEDE
jgi:hypothetical protein